VNVKCIKQTSCQFIEINKVYPITGESDSAYQIEYAAGHGKYWYPKEMFEVVEDQDKLEITTKTIVVKTVTVKATSTIPIQEVIALFKASSSIPYTYKGMVIKEGKFILTFER
jgi:hypothetical protein